MQDMLINLFNQLPDWLKLPVFLVLVAIVVAYTVWWILSWRQIRRLKKDLRRVKDDLIAAETDRDELLARFEALDKVDNHVWKKPDQREQNQFRPKSERRARFIAISNLKGVSARPP